jgi:pimeloyl-ACP methyl ester carboxylesterase
VIDWIAPVSATSISEYAVELVAEFGLDASCDLVGVSFGGMVAQEVARLLGTPLCFVVSSASSSSEFRLTQRLLARLPQVGDQAILRTVGAVAERWPRSSSSMGTVRARKFQGQNGVWFRWATSAALRWRPVPYRQAGVVRIHGDRDRTFPHAVQHAEIVIPGAGHMLALTHSSELAKAIRQKQDAEQDATSNGG